MAHAALGNGLWLGYHLLAATEGLADGRRLGALASCFATAASLRRSSRLEPGLHGQRVHCSQKGGDVTGPNPTDRGRPGTKRHIVTDRRGIPLTVRLSGANVHDSKMLEPLLDAIPPIHGQRGRPRQRPGKLHADKGYDYPRCRRACTKRSIKHRIARKGIESSSHLGRHRWVVERTFAWLSRFRRLTVRYERRADIHLAFTTLACAIICLRALSTWF